MTEETQDRWTLLTSLQVNSSLLQNMKQVLVQAACWLKPWFLTFCSVTNHLSEGGVVAVKMTKITFYYHSFKPTSETEAHSHGQFNKLTFFLPCIPKYFCCKILMVIILQETIRYGTKKFQAAGAFRKQHIKGTRKLETILSKRSQMHNFSMTPYSQVNKFQDFY